MHIRPTPVLIPLGEYKVDGANLADECVCLRVPVTLIPYVSFFEIGHAQQARMLAHPPALVLYGHLTIAFDFSDEALPAIRSETLIPYVSFFEIGHAQQARMLAHPPALVLYGHLTIAFDFSDEALPAIVYPPDDLLV